MKKQFYLLLLLPLAFFLSCEKGSVEQPADLQVQQDTVITLIPGGIIKRTNGKAHVFFNNQSSSLTGPTYIIRPMEYIFDQQATASCNGMLWLEEGYTYMELEEPDDHSENLHVHYYSQYGQLEVVDVSGSEITIVGATPPIQKYLDCWCEYDPIEVVKKLN
ncbi:hypothetical protein [Sphingobacterium chungjuense]|uniref:hypothetical protein n=1 Tax=Sphingobacterium chungjuense TaxID=2675553 RepID=UPI001408A171|nr:hypothetical protein [Sphingobacterium chungjuense]